MSNPKIKVLKSDLSESELEYYSNQEILAIDCEMMGLNVQRDRLCLVQIGDINKQIVLVQIEQGQTEAPNLKLLMEAPGPIKLFHYARTDVTWLKYWLNIEVQNVFCTKIASKLARTYTDKHGLKELCKEVIGKELNKNQQSSDWGSSDLNKEQIEYAANDVVYLHTIYEYLKEILVREHKMELAKACCKFISRMAEMYIYGYNQVLEH